MNQVPCAQKRISIISWIYPPRNSIAARRPHSWVKYFESKNLSCHVYTANSIDRSSQTNFINIASIRLPFDQSLDPDRNRSFHRILSYFKNAINNTYFLIASLRKIIANPPEILITTYGPQVTLLIGYLYKKINPDVTWIADYRDLWTTRILVTDRSIPYKSLTLNIQYFERFVSKKYDIVTTVSTGLANALNKFLDKEVFVIYNGYSDNEESLKAPSLITKSFSSPTNIVYTGTLYPKKYYRYDVFFEAVQSAKIHNIIFDIYGNDNTYSDFREMKNGYECKESIHNHGLVNHELALAAQEGADYLLFFAWDDGESDGVLSGKIFEYLISGKPIIAIGCDEKYEVTQILKQSGCAFVVHRDIEKLAGLLLDLEATSSLPEWYRPNTDYISTFSRSNQARKLYDLIAQ